LPRTHSGKLLGAAPVFAALGDETRLRMVARLSEHGAMSITRLTAGTDISRQAISKHLRVLEAAGLMRAEKRGRESVWALDTARLEEARRHLDAISTHWDRTLERLKVFVEDGD
jgi:DNA-binding transcriptional ArsR family regulator